MKNLFCSISIILLSSIFSFAQVSTQVYYNLYLPVAKQNIDVNNARYHNGAKLQFHAKNGHDAQVFRFINAGSGWYYIVPKGSSKVCLGVSSSKNASPLILRNKTNSRALKWKVKNAGNGRYYLINQSNGKYISWLWGGGLGIYSFLNKSAQAWTIKLVSAIKVPNQNHPLTQTPSKPTPNKPVTYDITGLPSSQPYLQQPVFDWVYYHNRNSDLQRAYGRDKKKLQTHWLKYGRKEGRRASAKFDVKAYVNNYSDLKKTFKNNWKRGIDHFIKHGIKEGRCGLGPNKCGTTQSPTGPSDLTGLPSSQPYLQKHIFDWLYYYNHNSDLRRAYGKNKKKLQTHWLKHGRKEGRRASAQFDVKAYVNTYPDLKRAFKNNWKRGVDHFINQGVKENRCGLGKGKCQPPKTYLKGRIHSAFGANAKPLFLVGGGAGTNKPLATNTKKHNITKETYWKLESAGGEYSYLKLINSNSSNHNQYLTALHKDDNGLILTKNKEGAKSKWKIHQKRGHVLIQNKGTKTYITWNGLIDSQGGGWQTESEIGGVAVVLTPLRFGEDILKQWKIDFIR